jgi:predicted nucleotidyltransferase
VHHAHPGVLNGAVEAYIAQLRGLCPEISAIWHIGSRADGTAKAESDWDLLVFGTGAVLSRLRQSAYLDRKEFDVLVVFDDDKFERPWPGKPGNGSLSEWEWTPTSDTTATYCATKPTYATDGTKQFNVRVYKTQALRLWPSKEHA